MFNRFAGALEAVCFAPGLLSSRKTFYLLTAAFRISSAIESDKLPPMGNTICNFPVASMMRVRKL